VESPDDATRESLSSGRTPQAKAANARISEEKMLTLEAEIIHAIGFFGVMDTIILQKKLSMRRDHTGEFKQITQKQINEALRSLQKNHVVRKATGVRDGWTLVNP
jgi:hypothetical protein